MLLAVGWLDPCFDDRVDWSGVPTYWLVDPLDGTKEFLAGTDEFTVNIALIHQKQPVLGVVHAPALGRTYAAFLGGGSHKIEKGVWQKLPLHKPLRETIVVVSRSHCDTKTQAYLAQLCQAGIKVKTMATGSSLKFCLVAEGAATLYPRFGPTKEWDIAAGLVVACEAGCSVWSKVPLEFNKESIVNPAFTISRGALPINPQ